MDFKMLGALEVIDSGVAVEIKAPRQRAVLAMLLIDANRVVSLDRLVDQLYEGDPPPRAVGSVQAYISHLRRLLEPGRARNEKPEVLITRSPGYELRVARRNFDVTSFEDCLAEGQSAMREGRFHEALGSFERALELWRGPALAEFAHKPFARVESVRLEELRNLAQESAVEVKLALGQHTTVVAEAERRLAEQPLRERLWAALMVALYRSGRQGEALAAYRRCRETLDEELGVDPGPELRRLEADILAQSSSLEWRPVAVKSTDSVPSQSSEGDAEILHASAPLPSQPFVGRAQELEKLTAAFEESRSGRGVVTLIGGEAGIGKSAIVEQFTGHLSPSECLQARGVGEESGGAPAFFIWGQLVRALAAADGARFHHALETAEIEKHQLAPLVPEWHAERVDARAEPPAEARFRLYLQTSALLQVLSSAIPLVLVMEDLHWADPASLKLLEFVAARLRESSILVVTTYRLNEAVQEDAFNETLATVAKLPGTVRLFPKRLNRAEVSAYLAALTGFVAKEEVVVAILERTDGNPFFVTQLAALLSSENSLDRPADVHASPVPAGVREVVRRRLARLPKSTTALLTRAAVIGAEFDVADLENVADPDDNEFDQALDLANASGILVENSVLPDRFRFSHALIRDTLLDGISRRTRVRLHARIAEVLQESPRSDPAAVAHHLIEASPAVGIEKVMEAILRAAAVAEAALGFEQTEDLLRRAITLLDLPESHLGRDRNRWELLLQGKLMSLLARIKGYAHPDIEPSAQRMLSLSGAAGGNEMEVLAALFGLASFYMVKADYDASAQAGQAMLEATPETATVPYSAGGHFVVGVVDLYTGKLSSGRAHLEKAVLFGDRLPLGNPEWSLIFTHHPAVAARSQLAIACLLKGERLRAADLTQRSLQIARSTGNAFDEVFANWFAALAATLDRCSLEALAYATEAAELARDSGFALYAAIADVLRGFAMVHRGERSSAIALMEDGLYRASQTGAGMMHPLARVLLGEARLLAASKDEALASVDQALTQMRKTGEICFEAEVHRVRGEILASGLGSRKEAEDALRQAITVAQDQGASLFEERAQLALFSMLGAPVDQSTFVSETSDPGSGTG